MYECRITNGEQEAVLHELDPNSARKLLAGGFTDPVSAICIPIAHFTITPHHPAYTHLHEMTTIVRWINTLSGETEFEGRIVRKPKDGMTSDGEFSRQYTCEGLINYLRDSMQLYQVYRNVTVTMFLESLLHIHNTRCPDKIIRLGVCSVSGTITAATMYRSTLEEIRANLTDKLGGEIRLRRDAQGILRLDYMPELGVRKDTVIELGQNLVALDHSTDAGSIITRLIPLGKQLSSDSPERLTLRNFYQDDPDRYWVEDSAAAALYSDLEGTVQFDTIETQSELEAEALRYLAENNRIKRSYRAQVLDLSTIGEKPDSIQSGNTYRFRCIPAGLDEDLRIISRTVDAVSEPYKPTVEIGDKLTKLSEQQANLTRAITYTIPQQKFNILDTVQGMISDLMNGGLCHNIIYTGNEILIMDADTPEAATDVWQINGGGIAHSTNGYNGPYNVAILMDGTVAASFLLAGSVVAQNLTVTGGRIAIQASSETYDFINLSYTNEDNEVWRSGSTPLEYTLENTGIGCKWKAQSAAMFYYENDAEKLRIGKDGLVINNTSGNDVVQIYADTGGSGRIREWNAFYQKWLSLTDLENRVTVLEGRSS